MKIEITYFVGIRDLLSLKKKKKKKKKTLLLNLAKLIRGLETAINIMPQLSV